MAKAPEKKGYGVDYTVTLYGKAFIEARDWDEAKFLVENQVKLNKLIRLAAGLVDRPDDVLIRHKPEIKAV